MLCYRCGGHVKDGSSACDGCGQTFALGLKPGPIAGFGTGSRRHRVAIEGTPFKAGDAVGRRYQVRDHLGAGPVGWVYRAQDTEADTDLALKILSPRFLQTADEKKAFFAEMQKAKSLSHPNLVKVYDFGEDQDRPFVAQQLLEGLTLRRIMDLRRQKGQGFSLKEVEPILAQIAAALEAAGEQFAHGDLKPENVIVLPDLLKLTDFGLATSLPRAPFMAAQKAGGVHRYLAPEFLLGERLDARTDVYGLGAMLGEMLAGAQFEPTLDLVARNPGLPRGVESIFRRAVAPKPADRYANALELAQDLSELLESGAVPGVALGPHTKPNAPRPSTPPPMPRPIAVVPAPSAAAPVSASSALVSAPAAPMSASAAPLTNGSGSALSSASPLPPPVAAAGLAEDEIGDADIQESRTDPRVRIARALAAQDEGGVQRHGEPRRPQPSPSSGAAAVQIPGTLQTPVPEQAAHAHGATNGKGSDLAAIAARVGATPELLTAETAVKFAPTAPHSIHTAEIPSGTPRTQHPAPPVRAHDARPTASQGEAAATVAASAAAGATAAGATEAAVPQTIPMPGLDELEPGDPEPAGGARAGGKRRGYRAKKNEKEKRHGRSRAKDPEWTNLPAAQGPAVASQPPPAAPSEGPVAAAAAPVGVAGALPAAGLPSAAPGAAAAPATAAPLGAARADAAPLGAGRAKAAARRTAPTASFGALTEQKRKLSAPLLAILALALLVAIIAAVSLWRGGSSEASAPAASTEAGARGAAAKPADASKPGEPAKAAPQEVTPSAAAAQPAGAPAASSAASPAEPKPAAAAPGKAASPAPEPAAPAEETQPLPRKLTAAQRRRAEREEKKRALTEKLLARREARNGTAERRRAQQEALAQAESRRAQQAAAAATPPLRRPQRQPPLRLPRRPRRRPRPLRFPLRPLRPRPRLRAASAAWTTGSRCSSPRTPRRASWPPPT